MTNRIPIASPVRTAAIVNRYFVHAKKNLGQNFLAFALRELCFEVIEQVVPPHAGRVPAQNFTHILRVKTVDDVFLRLLSSHDR